MCMGMIVCRVYMCGMCWGCVCVEGSWGMQVGGTTARESGDECPLKEMGHKKWRIIWQFLLSGRDWFLSQEIKLHVWWQNGLKSWFPFSTSLHYITSKVYQDFPTVGILFAEIEVANWLTLPEDIEKPGEGYDCIICIGNSFAHLPDFEGDLHNQKLALHNFNYMLKPGGQGYIFFEMS